MKSSVEALEERAGEWKPLQHWIFYMTEVLIRLELPDAYRAQREHLFPSSESFAWFMRKNRDELVTAGALTKPNGRWLIQSEAFDRAVMAIGARRAGSR